MPSAFRLPLFALLALSVAPSTAHAWCNSDDPNVVCIDPRFIRGGIGAAYRGAVDIAWPDTPARHGVGLFLEAGAPFLSAILRATRATHAERGFQIYDNVYFDLILGGLVSDPLSYYTDQEMRFVAAFSFGWDVAAGWRFGRLTLLGGIRLQGVASLIGGTDQPSSIGGSYPLLARVEVQLAPRYPLFVMGYGSAFGPNRSYGAEVDLPVAPRFWIALAGTAYDSDASPANANLNANYPSALGLSAAAYLKVGPAY